MTICRPLPTLRSLIWVLSFFLCCGVAVAQDVSGYGYLNLPVSARVGALGGVNVSNVEADLALADQNPSLLCPEMSGQLQVGYMNYMAGVNSGYVAYAHALPRQGAWSASVRYLDYGTFKGYDAHGVRTSDFGAHELAFQGAISYPLGERWRAGAQLKLLYSSYERYSAFAMGVDAGLNYYNEVAGTAWAFTLANLGGQLKPLYDGRRQSLPTQLNIGFTKELEHLPFSLSVTGYHLFDWDHDYVDGAGVPQTFSAGEMVFNHLIFGIDWMATDAFYAALSYNYRNQRRFQGQGGFLRGLAFGAGVKYRQFDIQCSYASYNAATGSLMVQIGYSFNK